MLIHNGLYYLKEPFIDENELEQVFIANYEHICGPSSFYISKKSIKTQGNSKTIPDGFVIDVIEERWFIVEAELLKHGVHNHITPQISKQIQASETIDTKTKIEEAAVNRYVSDEYVRGKFNNAKIKEINVRQVLREILKLEPIVGIPIDESNIDLNGWAKKYPADIRIWLIEKFVEVSNSDDKIFMIIGDFEPQLEAKECLTNLAENGQTNEVRPVTDLLGMIEAGILQVSEKLYMSYKPKGKAKKEYEATLNSDGTLTFLGQVYDTPSSAALVAKIDAGSKGKTVNGWTTWKNHTGKTLDMLRKKYSSDGDVTTSLLDYNLDESLKIGKYVRSMIRILKEKKYSFSKEQIEQLTSKKWCSENLSISLPLFLIKTGKADERKDSYGYSRYYSTPFVFGGVEYYLTSQLKDEGYTRSKLRKWFLSL